MYKWDFTKLSLADVIVITSGQATPHQFLTIVGKCAADGAENISGIKVSEVTTDFMEAFTREVNPKAQSTAET